MSRQLSFRHALLAAVFCAFGVSGIALAAEDTFPCVTMVPIVPGCDLDDPNNECESNSPITLARPLRVVDAGDTGGATINAVIGNLTGPNIVDVDFFCFKVQEESRVTLDINGGMGGARAVDTILTLFGPGSSGFTLLSNNDDCRGLDFDACIEDYLLAPGIYTVAVTSYPCFPMSGGLTSCSAVLSNGDYTLAVSGVTLSVAVMPISIEIKPGRGIERAPVNPKSRGKIPVVLLSSNGFKPLDVDVASLAFGATGNEQSLSHCGKGGQDFNGDGVPDLLCHFENQLAHFTRESYEAILRGTTTDGSPFEGRGLLKVVPVKRQH